MTSLDELGSAFYHCSGPRGDEDANDFNTRSHFSSFSHRSILFRSPFPNHKAGQKDRFSVSVKLKVSKTRPVTFPAATRGRPRSSSSSFRVCLWVTPRLSLLPLPFLCHQAGGQDSYGYYDCCWTSVTSHNYPTICMFVKGTKGSLTRDSARCALP